MFNKLLYLDSLSVTNQSTRVNWGNTKQEVSIHSGGFLCLLYVCVNAHVLIMVLIILSVSVGKDRRRIRRPGYYSSKNAGRSWGSYWSVCATMTPAACLALPASHTTTSTGRPLRSGHVSHTHTHISEWPKQHFRWCTLVMPKSHDFFDAHWEFSYWIKKMYPPELNACIFLMRIFRMYACLGVSIQQFCVDVHEK